MWALLKNARRKARRALRLYPTKIALMLILPSLAIYLFFSIWPIVFSVYIAFTDANATNLSPNPQKLADLKTAEMCIVNVLEQKELVKEKSIEAYKAILKAYNETYTVSTVLKEYVLKGEIPDTKTASKLYEMVNEANNEISKAYDILSNLIPCNTTYVKILDPSIMDNLTKAQGLIASSLTILQNLEFSGIFGGVTISELNTTSITLHEASIYLNKTLSSVSSIALDFEGFIERTKTYIKSEIDKLTLHFVGFKNIYDLLHDSRFVYSVFKTLLFVLTSVPLKIAVGVALAFFFSSSLVMGRKIWRALLLIPWAIPILLSGVTWRILFLPGKGPLAILFSQLTHHPFSIFAGEWDAFLVYNLFEMWLAYPFIMTVTMGAIAGIPKEIIEASYIDGASIWLRFRKILLPQVKGPVLFATVLTTGASLQAFMVPLLINNGAPVGTISVLGLEERTGRLNEMMVLFGYNRAYIDMEYGYAAAVYIVLMVFLVIYLFAWLKVTKMTGGGR